MPSPPRSGRAGIWCWIRGRCPERCGSDDNLAGLAWHIRCIPALAIAFVVVGALIRLGCRG